MAPSLTINIRIGANAVCSFTSQYPFHGVQQIFRDVIGLSRPTPAISLIFFTSETSHNHHATRARRMAGLNVTIAVSDYIAPVEVQIEIPGGHLGQTGPGFAAIAIEAIRRRSVIRVMRAIIDRVE